jgi:hypothetical protein
MPNPNRGRGQQSRNSQRREQQRGREEARRKLAETQRQQRSRQLRIRAFIGAGALAVVAVIAVLAVTLGGGNASSGTGDSGAAAAAGGVPHAAQGATVDGIACQTSEQTAYHIHAHLAIFDHGTSRPVPAGIGIPGPQQRVNGFVTGGKCLYWLHTHDSSGIIHVESPTQRVYTLGQFFDIWGQRLTRDQAGAVKGTLTVFVNGRRFAGDPRGIKLLPQERIQLDAGTVTPPRPFTFPAGL